MTALPDRVTAARLPAVVELLGGSVGCELRLANAARRRDRNYELLLVNGGDVAVQGRLYGVDRRKRTHEFGVLAVGPNGLGRSSFMLPASAALCEQVFVEISGDGLALCAQAHLAPSRKPRLPIGWLAIAGAAAVALGFVAAAATLLVGRPEILALHVPSSSPVGTVTAQYAIGGLAEATYDAAALDGTVLADGNLSGARGTLAIALPARIAGQTVRLEVDARGPFGNAHREAVLRVEEPPAAPRPAPASAPSAAEGPHIGYFAAHRESDGGGVQSVLATYLASGTDGVVRVRDDHGAILGSRPFSHGGTTLVPLAGNSPSGPLRAELELTARGHVLAHSAIELPAQSASAADAGATDASTLTDPGSSALPTDPFVVQQRVVAGREFTISIRRPLPGMRIDLQTPAGDTLDGITVPAGAHAVTLRAPASSRVEIYYLAATFTRATSGEETLVRSLRIYPD